jgi:hypothetical protein
MFIRKALFVFLLLESPADPAEWIVDWRWLAEE